MKVAEKYGRVERFDELGFNTLRSEFFRGANLYY